MRPEYYAIAERFQITPNGYVSRECNSKVEHWAGKREPYSDEEIDACVAFLRDKCRRVKKSDWTSYGLKHTVERDRGEYVSNGSLLVAAHYLGIKVKRCHDDSLNGYVFVERKPNLSERTQEFLKWHRANTGNRWLKDFIDDALNDHTFPDDPAEWWKYVVGCKACKPAKDACRQLLSNTKHAVGSDMVGKFFLTIDHENQMRFQGRIDAEVPRPGAYRCTQFEWFFGYPNGSFVMTFDPESWVLFDTDAELRAYIEEMK